MLPPRDRVRHRVIRLDVVSLDFLENLVGPCGLFIFEIEDWVDKVLLLQQPKAVLPAKTGKECAFVKSSLGIEINLGRPPRFHSVFKLHPVGIEVVSPTLRSEGREIFDLQAAWLFQVVVISNDVWALLSGCWNCERSRGKHPKHQRRADSHAHLNRSAKLHCTHRPNSLIS